MAFEDRERVATALRILKEFPQLVEYLEEGEVQLLTLRRRVKKAEEARGKKAPIGRPPAPELIAFATSFDKLTECMKGLADALRILPQDLSSCLEKMMVKVTREKPWYQMEEKTAIMKDPKTGKSVCVLDIPKDLRALEETEGVLADLGQRLDEEGIDTPDLIKKAWKTSE